MINNKTVSNGRRHYSQSDSRRHPAVCCGRDLDYMIVGLMSGSVCLSQYTHQLTHYITASITHWHLNSNVPNRHTHQRSHSATQSIPGSLTD